MQNGVTIDDSTSSKDKFEIGDAIIGQLTVKLNNFNGKFTPHSFDGAVLKPSIGMVIKRDYMGDTLEWVPKGIFTVDAPDSAGSVLTITALDNMNKFDTDYSVSTLTYPTTLLQIVQDVCSISGVELETTAFTNSDYTVQDKPEEAATCNCREMLQYVASLAGCFARINRDGKLELKFYDFDSLKIPDGENGSPYLIDATTSLNYGKSDTTITGLQIIPGYSDIEQYKVGSDGYVVKINKNPLAQHDLQTLADNIWNDHLKSATFRELDSNIWSNPALEAGDTARIKDRQGNEYNIIISNLTFSLGSPEKISSDAESLSAKNAIRFSPLDKVTKSLTDLNGYYDTLKISVSKVEDGLELKVSKEDYNSEINILTTQINSKVSEGDIGSLIEQNPTSVVFAFNNQSSSQSVKIDGNGIYFYSNGSGIGHMGVTYNSTLGQYGICVQPANGQGTYFMPESDYALMCLGRIKASELAADGMISTPGMVSAGGFKTAQGDVGKTEDMTLKDLDGANYHLVFKDGLLVNDYY